MTTNAADSSNAQGSTTTVVVPGQEPTGTSLGRRKGQYLVAIRTVPGFMPMSADSLHSSLANIEGVEVVKRVKPRGFGTLSTDGTPSAPEIIVARMDDEKATLLAAQAKANPLYIVEPDATLIHAAETSQPTFLPQFAAPSGQASEIQVQIVGTNDVPLPEATVQIYGAALPSQGTTDRDGNVRLSVFGNVVRAIYVKPAANYWERMVLDPHLAPEGPNRIALRPLTETWSGFPDKGIVGWGQAEMQLDRINPALLGRGIKIGIIDSGCDNTHPQLRHVQNGVDLTAHETGATSWKVDTMSHGTHCAGIIGAASEEVHGIRGFAPAAEIFALKVFPGGRSSDLIDALDQCIDLGIDVVNMSLGTDSMSELVAQKIREATSKGVACIVAAGNSGGAIQFPGSLPSVLTVSAVGKTNTFPADTAHAMTVLPGGIGEIFPAKFSCFGPKIDVAAPGVAILSCVPGGYAAWDGTSMATPHVTGLAALVLAHHPAFQGKPRQATAQRVQQLFEILKGAAAPCVRDAQRGGAGMPNTVAAVGQVAAVAQQQPPIAGAIGGLAGLMAPALAAERQRELLQGLSVLAYNAALYQTVLRLRAMGLA